MSEHLNLAVGECKAVEYTPVLLVVGIDEVMKVLKTLPPAQVKAAVSELDVIFRQLRGVGGRVVLFEALREYKIPYDDKAVPTEADREAAVKALEPVLAKYRLCVVDVETFLKHYVKDVVYDGKGDGRLIVTVVGPWGDKEILELPVLPWVRSDGTPAPPRRLKKLELIGLKLDDNIDPEVLRQALYRRATLRREAVKNVIAEAFDKLLKEHPPTQERNEDRPWCSLAGHRLYIQNKLINELDREYAKKLGARYRLIRYAQELGVIVGETRLTFGDARPWFKVIDLDKLAKLLGRDPAVICGKSYGIDCRRLLSEVEHGLTKISTDHLRCLAAWGWCKESYKEGTDDYYECLNTQASARTLFVTIIREFFNYHMIATLDSAKGYVIGWGDLHGDTLIFQTLWAVDRFGKTHRQWGSQINASLDELRKAPNVKIQMPEELLKKST